MKIDIISCQPRMFEGLLREYIVRRAADKGLCSLDIVDLRQYGEGKYRKIDDKPYGGGPGCLMMCAPWFAAVEDALSKASPGAKPRVIMTSPGGKKFCQRDAEELAKEEHIIFMCGHYEGFDARIRTLATDEYSLGEFVMTGGELAAAAMADSIVRLLPGALGGGAEATASESFAHDSGMVEEPQYTHPAVFRGMAVPDVLLSGNHAAIEAWRKAMRRKAVSALRPAAPTPAPASTPAPVFTEFDAFFMRMALREAEKAASDGEVPTGCVIVEEPSSPDASPSSVRILGRAHNQAEGLVDSTAHAEILALSSAFQACGNWRLTGTRMYVTKEPCPMCAGAIALARIPKVVWGVSDPKRGGGSVFGVFSHPGMNHHPQTASGLLEDECRDILQRFFRSRRS